MALIDRSELKLILGVSTATDDLLYDLLTEAACAAVEKYCGRTFERSAVTERYTGNGSDKLVLRNRPVLVPVLEADLRVWVDPTYEFADVSKLTYGTDYILDLRGSTTVCDSGMLILLRNPTAFWTSRGSFPSAGGLTLAGRSRPSWGMTAGAIKVTSYQGYSTIPADLRLATVQVATWLYRSSSWGGQQVGSRSYIDTSISVTSAVESLASGAVPALGSARQILARYREIPFSGGL